jgi:hypothetical protein
MAVHDVDLEDAQLLAKALVTSMLAEPGPAMHLSDRTRSLLQAALGAVHEHPAADDVVVDAARTRAVLWLTADIAVCAIRLLAANGIDVEGQLVSPFLLPETVA